MKAQVSNDESSNESTASWLYGFFAPVARAICNGMGAVVGIEEVEEGEEAVVKGDKASRASLK